MGIKKTDILTFAGGLMFFSVVVGVVVSKNDRIRNEIEEQVEGFLSVGRNVLQQLRFVVAKVSKLTGGAEIASVNNTINEQGADALSEDYDALWQAAETQNKAYTEGFSLE
jgi:hypothetical protein